MKNIAILGSTGSIGTSTLRVVEAWPERFRVVALAGGHNTALLAEQARRFHPGVVSVATLAAAAELGRDLPGTRIVSGSAGLVAAAIESGADIVVAGLVGAVGLEPTLAALTAGIDVALANKETLVMAGGVMTAAARASGSRLLPLDSEHAALHQILEGRPRHDVLRLVLTASGGPFRTTPLAALRGVTVEQALRHPTWAMGDKITVDSATLANKGLEVIEAHWLFDIPIDRVAVLVHPQSTVHALVEMVDGTCLAQLGVNDMRSPIQYALTYPERWPTALPRLDLAALARLDFERPDETRFPCLRLAYQAAHAAGAAPAAFNAANEVANAAFRARRLDFMGIPAAIEHALAALVGGRGHELEEIMEADRRARVSAERFVTERAA